MSEHIPSEPLQSEHIQSKQDVLLESLHKFYECAEHLRVLTDVLKQHNQHDKVSLRILDWLVTNYAKKHNIVYVVRSSTFNMFLEYKSQLKAYSKRFFDPFCRRERLEFPDADGGTFHTTVGQLNFFRWAISNGVIAYGTAHNSAIEEDMLQSIKHRGTSTSTCKPKRRELSKAAIKGCTKTHVKVTVKFT